MSNAVALRVLVADDDASIREALTAVLAEDRSLELVATAADATQAGDLAERFKPDVALIDVRMPAGGGIEATRQIRLRSPLTVVVAHSASDDRRSVLAMLESGALGYVLKGSTAIELLDTIRRSALHQSSLSAGVAGHVVDELARKLRQERANSASLQVLLERTRAAIEGDALAMAFQPIFSLPTRKLAGFEALARFRTTLVQPIEAWFSDAAAVGLRVELELAAIGRALAQISLLAEDTYLSLNASPDTLLSPELAVLLERPLRPRIVLELTEHAPIDNYAALADALAPLRADGVRLAVDDAGAGFASLRHILQLDPDLIKIDRSLTENLGCDSRVRALAAAIVAFARETGVTVVGEGIETVEQLHELQALGAASAQGYLLGKPAFLDTVTVQPLTTSGVRTGS